MIDPKLTTLLTILKTGSFTKAAETLNLTQPALSHHIRSLEAEYNIHIFYPKSKKIKLTPEGKILEKYAKKQQNLYNNFLRELESYTGGERPFKIGLTPTAEVNLVPSVIARYCSAHPDTKVTISTDSVKKIYNKLQNRDLDFAIIEGSISDPELESRKLSTDYLCLIVSPNHPLAREKVITLDDVKQLPLIIRPQSAGTRQLFEEHLASRGEKLKRFNIIMEIDNVSTLKALVMSNLGASIVAHSSCVNECKQGLLQMIHVKDLNIHREINIICHKDFSYPNIIDELCRIYEDAIR